jgi:hypothetical protein
MSTGSKESLTVNKFEIKSNKNGRTFDISKGDPNAGIPGKTPLIEYRESVFTPFVEIKTILVDEGTAIPDGDGYVGVMEGLELAGTEEVKFQITDGAGNTIDLTGINDLRLSKPGVTLQAYKSSTTELVIYSKEVFDNTLLENNVRQKLDGKISDAVLRILEQDLKSEKSRQVDETLNESGRYGLKRKPFDVILELQQQAIPNLADSKGKMAGYLFWQTSLAFYFKSLDKIFSGNPVGRFVFNNKVGPIPPGFDDKILDYKVNRTIDALDQLESGARGTEIHYFDRVTQTYTKSEPFVAVDEGNGIIAGEELPKLHPDYEGKATIRIETESAKGQDFALGDSSQRQIEKTTQQNLNMVEILQQAQQNYRQKFSVSAEIVIPCNLSIHAGDLIYCEFPENSKKKTLQKNPRTSGIYMISDLCHYTNTTQAYTKLRLVRDSLGVR